MNDYLFDNAGEPEEDILKIERALGELRFKAAPLEFGRLGTGDIFTPAPAPAKVWRQMFYLPRLMPAMLAASSVIFTVVALGLWFTWFMSRSQTLVRAPVAGESSRDVQSSERVASPSRSPQLAVESAPPSQHTLGSSALADAAEEPPQTARRHNVSARNAGRTHRSRTPHGVKDSTVETKTPAVAASELLLALDVTQRTLDKAFGETQQKVRSQFSTVSLPAFMTDAAR